jgi:hypothetical protein
MSAISVTSVNVLDNPSKVTNPLQFEIQYECMFDLADGEQWARLVAASQQAQRNNGCCVLSTAVATCRHTIPCLHALP